jgi:hypothetical protein
MFRRIEWPGVNARRLVVAAALLALTSLWPTSARADETVRAFLSRLEASWTGSAEITPRGPRPYDMTLARTTDGRMTAAANPGRSVHHWSFYEEGGALRLEFMSTFGGNDQPTRFKQASWIDGAASFRAEKPDHMVVIVRLSDQRLDIDVMHRGRLHVGIRLTRK